jgi:uncharacterized protein (TIGR02147 family)
METNETMKSVFEYIDYRRYLKDFYDFQKKTKKYFSYRFFAQKAGINAPILLKMVIDGKRNLSRKTLEKFSVGLNLKEKEAVYFRNLVLFNQAKSALEKQEHYRVLQSMAQQTPQFVMENDHFEYFDKWYFSVVREGICQFDYQDDWSKIAAGLQPLISAVEAREAVGWLLKRGLIKKNKGGRYVQVHTAITTRSEVRSMVVRNFNRKMIQLAEQSLDAFPTERRYATGITVGLTKEAYNVLVAEIEAFRDRVVNIVDALETGDRVCQVNIQLFPLMVVPEPIYGELEKKP